MIEDPFATATEEDIANLCDVVDRTFPEEATRDRIKRTIYGQWHRARGEAR